MILLFACISETDDADDDRAEHTRGRDGDSFEYEVGGEEGYLTLDVTDVRGGDVDIEMYLDGQHLATEGADLDDADLHAWLAVEADRTYVFVVEGAESYQLAIEHHAVPDAFEPDDGWEDAHVVTDTATAYFHAGYATDRIEDEDFDDWFAYESDGTPFEVRLSDVPDDLQGGIEIWEARDMTESVVWEWSNEQGKDVVEVADRVSAGTYYLRLRALRGEGHGIGEPPSWTAEPYTLTVATR